MPKTQSSLHGGLKVGLDRETSIILLVSGKFIGPEIDLSIAPSCPAFLDSLVLIVGDLSKPET